MPTPSSTHRHQRLREQLAPHGQDHVLAFWAGLSEHGRLRLAQEIASLDLEALECAWREARARADRRAGSPVARLAPAPVERLPERGGDGAAQERARATGEQLLAEGRVAVLVVAGGQGTRLGFAGPKGTFPIGPVSGRSLFGLQAERLRGLRARYGRPLPWLVMTSPATDAATRAHFAQADGFGLPQEDVIFFAQRTLPCLDFEGRLMLAAPDRLARAPDGHGGVLRALREAGALPELAARGVDTLVYVQVDNPLAPLGDTRLLGWHADQAADWTCKVVEKQRPDERLGTVVRRGDGLAVVEYTELPEAQGSECAPGGGLRLWAGAISAHALSRAFLEEACEATDTLPWHAASKRIACVDARGQRRLPEQPNGIKLERFVFDALPRARRAQALEVRREEEYAPVKDALGEHAPETVRRALSALYRRWLERRGWPAPAPDHLIEIDQSLIEGPDDAPRARARRAGAPPLVLTATGVAS